MYCHNVMYMWSLLYLGKQDHIIFYYTHNLEIQLVIVFKFAGFHLATNYFMGGGA